MDIQDQNTCKHIEQPSIMLRKRLDHLNLHFWECQKILIPCLQAQKTAISVTHHLSNDAWTLTMLSIYGKLHQTTSKSPIRALNREDKVAANQCKSHTNQQQAKIRHLQLLNDAFATLWMRGNKRQSSLHQLMNSCTYSSLLLLLLLTSSFYKKCRPYK